MHLWVQQKAEVLLALVGLCSLSADLVLPSELLRLYGQTVPLHALCISQDTFFLYRGLGKKKRGQEVPVYKSSLRTVSCSRSVESQCFLQELYRRRLTETELSSAMSSGSWSSKKSSRYQTPLLVCGLPRLRQERVNVAQLGDPSDIKCREDEQVELLSLPRR